MKFGQLIAWEKVFLKTCDCSGIRTYDHLVRKRNPILVQIPLRSLNTSDIAPVLRKKLLDIQETIECRFTLKCVRDTTQKMKFSIKDLFSKCDQIRRNQRIWSHLLKKSLMENFIFFAVWHDNNIRSNAQYRYVLQHNSII